VKVYAGTDPLTGREIRFRKTCKTEQAAQIELESAGTESVPTRSSTRSKFPARQPYDHCSGTPAIVPDGGNAPDALVRGGRYV
jgi:hypothetical protein